MRSKLIEIHSNDEDEPIYVHEDLLRKQSKNYDQMIDEAVQTNGKACIQLDLPAKAIEKWIGWMYGVPMQMLDDIDYFEPLLDLYDYSQTHLRNRVDHKLANACLDGLRAVLRSGFEDYDVDWLFEASPNFPTLTEAVNRLGKHNGEGVQMLVDLLVHGSIQDTSTVVNLVSNMKPAPCLASFSQI